MGIFDELSAFIGGGTQVVQGLIDFMNFWGGFVYKIAITLPTILNEIGGFFWTAFENYPLVLLYYEAYLFGFAFLNSNTPLEERHHPTIKYDPNKIVYNIFEYNIKGIRAFLEFLNWSIQQVLGLIPLIKKTS